MDDQVVINQHYVPQFYLERFTCSDGRVYVFDKPTNKVFKQSVRNIAYERYFYDLPGDAAKIVGDVQYLEKRFCHIEGKFVKAVNELLDNLVSGKPMDFTQKRDLAYFLMVQDLRTVHYRNVQVEMINGIIKSVIEEQLELEGIDLSTLNISVGYEDKEALLLQASFIFNPP